MTRIERIEALCDDVMNMKMSVHAYALACKAIVLESDGELTEWQDERMAMERYCISNCGERAEHDIKNRHTKG